MTAPHDTTLTGGPAPGLPGFLEIPRRALHVIGQAELVLAVAALVVVVVISGAQALLRYAFGTSLWWAQEIAATTIIFSYFLGISYVYKTRQDILVEFVTGAFPIRLQVVVYILVQIATIVFTLWTVVLVVRFAPTAMNMTTPILRLPGILTTLPIGIGSAMIVLTSLYYLALALWALARGTIGHSLHDVESLGLVTAPVTDPEAEL